MEKAVILSMTKNFEESAFESEGVECWSARDLQHLLEYSEWRNFELVIEKAKASCKSAGIDVNHHFVDVNKMVEIGSGVKKEVSDILLTRYACYLVAQNGDPRKQTIAFAQTYFAVQTRKQEILEERIALMERLEAREKLTTSEKELSGLIYERGVDNQGFARIRSSGDNALFGGNSTLEMKHKLNVPVPRSLADFLPTVTISAKNFATEITNFNLKKDSLYGETKILNEHIKNNLNVREVLGKSGIIPEILPPEEDIKKLERRVERVQKEISKSSGSFKKSV